MFVSILGVGFRGLGLRVHRFRVRVKRFRGSRVQWFRV